ncbi:MULTISPECIES: phage major capsid protein [Brucella]|uniref:phage major capsid protein n=1 Tax=Brucella TaxID=234 RepID=UPI0015908BB9|nr:MULTISPECIES: phage major capsid protein [Brucella]
MPFTVDELENIANSAMDYHWNTPEVRKQTLQDRPLLEALTSVEETFPGGKEYITGGVKGDPTTGIQGFEADDTVSYSNPTGTKRFHYPWKLIHGGIKVTMHELAKDGISISDSATGKGESNHSQREKTVLANIFKEKLWDMSEGIDRDMNEMYWGDGSTDPKLIPGITSFIHDNPTAAGVVGGIDQVANTWWRNRALLGITATDPNAQNVVTALQKEWRQLRRYGGRPNLVLAGSDFLEAIEKELRAKGSYTLEGWTSKSKTDASIADISFKGVSFKYDPTLDDMSKSKYCYVLDTRHIKPMVLEGENWKNHNPARPENQYVIYRAKTYMGGLICDQRNVHGVYSIA